MNIQTTIAITTTIILIIIAIDLYKWVIKKKKKKDSEAIISFKETFELVDVPVVTFKVRDINGKSIKMNFIIDTGASESVINKKELRHLDQSKIDFFDLDDPIIQTACGSQESAKGCYLELCYDNVLFVNPFSIANIDDLMAYIKEHYGVSVAGIIGSAFFNKSNADINFEYYKVTLKNGKKKTNAGNSTEVKDE